ncbi:MAG: hypothetical protein ABSD41_07340 [Candidatus Bathyarchaeia archaeon]|jgi:hypothetical protein
MNIQKLDKQSKILVACFILAEVIFFSFSTSGVYAYSTAPDFGMTISPTCAILQNCIVLEPRQIGLTATYKIQYFPFSGFMDTITETVSGVPAAYFSMGTFFLSEPTSDILSLDNLAAGTTYTLTITAVASSGISHAVTATLTTPAASTADSDSNGMIGSNNAAIPDFNMVITPATQVPGVGVTYYISYTSINGFTGPIDEKVANLPPQFVSFFSQPYPPPSSPSYGRCYVRLNVPKSCTDALTIYFTIGSNTNIRTFGSGKTVSLIVTGNAEGGLPSHSVTIPLTVP